MTVVEKACSTAPRSALRYRPISSRLDASSQVTTHVRKSRTSVRAAMPPVIPDDRDHEQHPVARLRCAPSIRQTRTWRDVSPRWFIGSGFVVALLLWVGVTQAISWGTNEYNAIIYGSPRTFQIDAFVGQGDSPRHPSHFEAVNLHGIVTILEFLAGDAHHLRVLATYTVPGPDADQAVAMIRFFDRNHNGKPDLIVDINGIESILVNDGTSFRPPTSSEEQSLLQALQRNQN